MTDPFTPGGTTTREADQRERAGSGFVNINRFLKANRGNKLASTVNKGIQSDLDQYNNQLNQTQNQFQNQINTQWDRLGNINSDINNVFRQIGEEPSKLVYAQNPELRRKYLAGENPQFGGAGNERNTPSPVSVNPPGNRQSPLISATSNQSASLSLPDYSDFDENNENNAYKRFEKYRQERYQGPQSIDENAQRELMARADGLAQLRGTLSDPNKRGNLLSQYINNPGYNAQHRSLDSVLFGFAPASKNINANQIGNVTSKVNNLKTSAEANANLAARNFANIGNSINQTADVNSQAVQKLWADRTAHFNATRAAETEALKNAIRSGGLNSAQAESLGLTDGMETFGLLKNMADPLYFSEKGPVAMQNIIGDSDRARLRTYDMLRQQTPTLRNSDSAFRDGELPGTLDSRNRTDRFTTGYGLDQGNGYNFNTRAFMDAVNAKKDEFDRAMFRDNAATGIDLEDAFSSLPREQREALRMISGDNPVTFGAGRLYQFEEPINNLLSSLASEGKNYGALGQKQLLDNFEKQFNASVVAPWQQASPTFQNTTTSPLNSMMPSGVAAPTNTDYSSDTKRSEINNMIARYQAKLAEARKAVDARASAYRKSFGADERL